jgi:hypothetical protein
MIMIDRLMLQRAESAAGAASHQISSLLVLFLATVLMASPSLASSSNVHRNVRAQHVWQAKKDFTDYRGLYGYQPQSPATGEPARPYDYCPGYVPGESPEDVCPNESNGG